MAHPTVNVFLSLSYHLKAMTRIHGRIFSLTQTKSYLKIFRSSLQSHPIPVASDFTRHWSKYGVLNTHWYKYLLVPAGPVYT